ncbi:MAG TPA: STAS domain-containing protein, partial [Methylibium sp.]
KAKIDEIEQQMVGEGLNARGHAPARPSSFYNAPTQPAAIGDAPTTPMHIGQRGEPRPAAPAAAAMPPAAVVMGAGMSPLSPFAAALGANDFANPFAVEVNEIAHDPELDEAVIAFANADFELCEQSLSSLIGMGGSRAQHAETWLVLFDLYRAIGQQHKFESLALDYAQQFGWSAPQWFSLPLLVAEAAAAAEDKVKRSGARVDGSIGWVAPDMVDIEAVAKLRAQTLQMPLPWVLDWNAVRSIDAEACHELSLLMRGWAGQNLDMRWLGGEHLLGVLAECAPAGVRDADPAFWLLRLDALRLTNRADQFDEVAIDYCVTYEVSPPSWEPARCVARVSEGGRSTTAPVSVLTDVSTGFDETQQQDDGSMVPTASVELSGQLVGDIGQTLDRLQGQLGAAAIVSVSCSRLIRVDFIAAGDLLNWVLARRGENRTVSFDDAHRLVALFFGAMGINEHARVKVRNI